MADNVSGAHSSSTPGPSPDHWPAEPLRSYKPEWTGFRCNLINIAGSWTSPVVNEWELRSAGWQDLHEHDELNYILEGELHIECNGHEVVLQKGDLGRIPAGAIGRYWAPNYARMISMYGPNPEGSVIQETKYWDIAPASDSQ